MARNNRIIVEVDGDTTGLQKKLNQAQGSISNFGNKAGGEMGNAANKISGGLSQISGGITGIVGAAGIAGVAIGGLVLKVNDLVRELNQMSTASGLSVTAIQQWNKTFREAGLDAEKVMDLNQDSLDKLGDSFRNGGSLVDDFTAAGLNIKEFTPLLSETDGGLKAVIKTFYDLKAAGADQATQTWILETLASDASRLIPILNESADAQDAWNKIHSQTVTVTEEAAKNFKEFDRNLNTLKDTGGAYLVDVLNPIVKSTNDLIKSMEDADTDHFWINLIDKANKFQAQLNKLNLIPGMSLITSGLQKGIDAVRPDEPTPMGTVLLPASPAFSQKAGVMPNAETGWVDKGKVEAEAEKAQKAMEAAARKAEAAAAKVAAKRIQAERALEVALSTVAENAGEQRLQVFDRQQKELLKTIQETATTIGKSTSEIEAMIERAKAAGQRSRDELVNSLIGYSNPNQDLIDANNTASMGLNSTQNSFLVDQQSQRINGDNPFAYDNSQRLIEENAQHEELELQLNEQLLGGTEEFEKRKAEIQARYAAQAMQLAQQNTQQQMAVLSGGIGDMGTMIEGVFGEGSKAAAAAFAIQKGINMASIMMNMQVALSQAMATPFPASILAYAQVAAMGAQIINTAKGVGVQGQAHSGIEEVPGSLGKDSTWVLQAGERVVSRGQNEQLQKFLDGNTSGNSTNGGGETSIYAPLIVQGSVGDDDAKFNDMLKKHSQSVNQAVRDAQKRST